MSEPISVDCVFDQDGRVQVRRIKLDDHWLHVDQGRQWLDENGRHILIMLPGSDVQEILLSPGPLRWQLLPHRTGPAIV